VTGITPWIELAGLPRSLRSGFRGAYGLRLGNRRSLRVVSTGDRRKDCRRWLGRGNLPIAVFPDAGTEAALLGALLDDERRTALRARFVDGFVRRCEIAIGVAAAAKENASPPAPLGRSSADEFSLVALRAFDAHRNRARILALWIILAADEIAKAALATQQFAFGAGRALFSDGDIGRFGLLRTANQTACGFAVRITRTG
jgi:hypothetical protein